MARIRTIKPEFWSSEQVMACSFPARLLFIGLWNFCDDHGRHKLSEKTIKAEVFPGDDLSIETIRGMLQELSDNGLIKIYTFENKAYLFVPGWHHQRIDKVQPPKHPDPFHEHSTNIPGTLPPYRKGREGIGREKIPLDPKTDLKDAAHESSRVDPLSDPFFEERQKLWGNAARWFGRTAHLDERKAKSFVGKCLQLAGGDVPATLEVFQRARIEHNEGRVNGNIAAWLMEEFHWPKTVESNSQADIMALIERTAHGTKPGA